MAVLGKQSPIYRLAKNYFGAEGWKSSSKDDLGNLQRSLRQIAEISAVLAGVSLATLAIIFEGEIQLVQLIGGLMMIGSAAIFFWAVGIHFVNSLGNVANNFQLRAALFKKGFIFTSLGIFMFYNGLVWSLSARSIWYPILSAIGYGIIFAIMWSSTSIKEDKKDPQNA